MKTTRKWKLGLQLLVLLLGIIVIASCSDSDSDITDPGPNADTTPPTISLAVPDTVMTQDGNVTLAATATDNVGVTAVDFYDGATKIGSADALPFQYIEVCTEGDNGLHRYWAMAIDAAGNSANSDTLSMIVAINHSPDFVNGGFDIDATGWNLYNCSGANGFVADEGNPGGCIRLNDHGTCPVDPTVEQVVTGLIPGLTYTMTGEYRTFVDWIGSPTAESLVVTVDSVLVGSWARSPDHLNWYPFQVDFVATETSHTIAVLAEWECDDSSYDVDNLKLRVTLP